MLDFDISILTIGCLLIFIVGILLKKYKNKDNIYLLFFSVFSIYIVFVLKYTIFPIPLDKELIETMRNNDTLAYFNLMPFKFDLNDLSWQLKQVVYNIILTVPFGFGLPFLTRINKRELILSTLAIECLQLIISLIIGFPYRYFDMNDIVFNLLGVIIGYFIFRILAVLFVKVINKFKVKLNPVMKYIYDVSKSK